MKGRFIELVPSGTKIDFMGKKWFFAALSLVMVVVSIGSFFTKGFRYGIDFAGGLEVQIQFKQPTSIGSIRDAFKGTELEGISVQSLGKKEDNEYLLSLRGASEDLEKKSNAVKAIVSSGFGEESFEVRRVDMVGPRVGRELKKGALLAILYALLGILIYVGIRFDFIYAPGAVICLIHDVIITAGFFSLTGREFDLAIIAALLTIVGYSLNDTIVIFDRIRELWKKDREAPLLQIINAALNQTLSRTVLTAGTTLLAIFALYLYGGAEVRDFALAIIIGVIVGTYSTVAIANPIFYGFHLASIRK